MGSGNQCKGFVNNLPVYAFVEATLLLTMEYNREDMHTNVRGIFLDVMLEEFARVIGDEDMGKLTP